MAVSSLVAAAGGKTMYRTTLTSGTSYTVPAGVTYLNVTLVGGGGGGDGTLNVNGRGGQIVYSTLSTTPGASITYAIGAGGAAITAGGTTTFTGATSAVGGGGSIGQPPQGESAQNYGRGTGVGGSAIIGNAGVIYVEYWA
jgi:hypothetical protein